MKNPPEFPLCRVLYEGLSHLEECPRCKSNFYRTNLELWFAFLFSKPQSTKCINPDCPNADTRSIKP